MAGRRTGGSTPSHRSGRGFDAFAVQPARVRHADILDCAVRPETQDRSRSPQQPGGRRWPPSRGMTSKSPMHAGAASSLGVHARLARRARQRRRVYQSGKGTAANRGGSGWWPVCSARDLPRPAPRQRPGPAYGLVLLGDPPSFDEDDSDPHCCVKPLDAVALPSLAATAACRTRHGPAASCSAPMASRLRCLVTVYGPGCLSGHRDYLKRHDSLGFDQGLLLRPVVPREPSERLARPPPAVSDVHVARNRAHGASGSIRPRRPSTERRGASVPTRVHPPPQLRHTRVSRHCALAPRRRHPQAMAAAPTPDFHRPSGLPVCRDGSRPRRHRAAPTWPLQ